MRIFALFLLTGVAWGQLAEQARGVLRDGFVEKAPDKRREVAVALSMVPSKDPTTELLASSLRDKDVLVRQAAIESLAELGDKGRYPLLKAALADEVPEVAYAAARALWKVGDPAGAELLEDIYAEEAKAKSPVLKSEMRKVMRRMKTPGSAILFAVERGLIFVPVPGLGAGYSAMSRMLLDETFSARATSLVLLCQDPKRRSTGCEGMLERAFVDEDWSVRAAAVQLVAGGRNAALRGKLVGLFGDKSEKVRYRAAAAYLRLDPASTRLLRR
jgi:HEAT repeat protein